MFAKLKESKHTFTDFFAECPLYDDKENINRANIKLNITSLNLSEYLKQQKLRSSSEVSKSCSRASCNTKREGNFEATAKNLSKLVTNIHIKSKCTNHALPPALPSKQLARKEFKFNIKTLLAGQHRNMLKMSLKSDKQGLEISSYRSFMQKRHNVHPGGNNGGQSSARVLKSNLKDIPMLLKSIKEQKPKLTNGSPRIKLAKVPPQYILNLKTIDVSVCTNQSIRPSSHTQMGHLDVKDNESNFKYQMSKRGSVNSLRSCSNPNSTNLRPRRSLKVFKQPLVSLNDLACIRETHESNKHSFKEYVTRLETEMVSSFIEIPGEDGFIFNYAEILHGKTRDFWKLYDKVDRQTIIAVLDWVYELAAELELSRSTTHLSFRLFFNYLMENPNTNIDSLQFDALTCLYVTIKLEEVKTLQSDDLVLSLEPKYERDQLIVNEARLLSTIKKHFSNHNIFTLNQTIQLLWDGYVDAENPNIASLFDFVPKFRAKGYANYVLYRVNSEMLDFSLSSSELIKEEPLDIIAIILYYTLARNTNSNHSGLLPQVQNFLKLNRLIRCERAFIDKLAAHSYLATLQTSFKVPENNKCSAYEDFLLLQTYNNQLLNLH